MAAPTPRYLGTTLAEAKSAFQEYLGADLFKRIFDLDGDGTLETEDDDVFGRACAAAETEFDEILAASHGAPLTFASLTSGQQNSVRDIVARMTPFLAVEIRPIASTDEKGKPYEADPLFSYLWQRKFRTTEYRKGGLSRALDLILTGRAVDADEALRIGLATRVVPEGKAIEAAQELAREIAELPQDCLRNDRASMYDTWGKSDAEALAVEWEYGKRSLASDARDGASRFADGAGRHGA